MQAPREVISVDVPVDFETAWAHVRDPGLIRRWWGWDHEGLDHDIERTFLREATVQRPDPQLPVAWLHWHNNDRLEVRGGLSRRHSTVLVRRPDHLLLASYDGVRDEVDEQWITWLHQLRFALTEHFGQERRSFAVHGLAGERQDRILYQAGLYGARGTPVGGAVEIRRPDGSIAGGRLEYSTPHQFGVRLRGHGDSLLVVQLLPPASRPPRGSVNVFWSVWGLEGSDLAAAEDRWASWWRTPQLSARG